MAKKTSIPEHPSLFERAGGSPLEGYFLVKAGKVNVPPAWFERAQESRINRHEATVTALQEGDWGSIETLRDWEKAYQKESFYYGIRVLLELERAGKTKL